MACYVDDEWLNRMEDMLTSIFIDVVSTVSGCGLEKAEVGSDDKTCGHILAQMFLHGEHNCLVTLESSRETAATVTSYMTGFSPDELSEDDMFDSIGELLNITAGCLKQKLSGSVAISLSSPIVIVSQSGRMFVKKGLKRLSAVYEGNGLNFFIKLIYI